MKRAVVDIETVLLESDLVSSDHSEEAEEDRKKAALNALTARIVCVGLVFTKGDYEAESAVALLSKDEKSLLRSFWALLAESRVSTFIAHNGLNFDLPFLWKRSVINGVKPSVRMDLRRYRSDFIFDTMAVWANWDSRNYASLDLLSRSLKVGEKSGSGDQVLELWKGEKYSDLGNYCLQDCWLTLGCYCKMNFQKLPVRVAVPEEIRILE